MEATRFHRKADDGFSVVEVVFAAAILFFALTALIGLMGVSSSMTGSARAKSVLNNAITSELDWVRSIPFERVALTTQVPAGDIPATRTYVKDGYTVTLTFTVTDTTATNGTKEVRVNAVATRQGQPDVQSSAFAAIRNRLGATMADADGAPVIEFTAPTPPSEAIVYGNSVSGSTGKLTIASKAWSENYAIARIEYMIGSTRLRDGNTAYSNWSEIDYSVPQQEQPYSFEWHTGQLDSAGLPSVADGKRVVRIIAYDDQGRRSAARERVFIVDNYPPAVPDGRTLRWAGAIDAMGVPIQWLEATWNPALDGTDYAPFHEAEVYENTNGASTLAAWGAPTSLQGTTTAEVYSLPVSSAMGCYSMQVKAISPSRQLWSAWGTTSPMVSRPVITGESDVTRTRTSGSRDTWTFVTRSAVQEPRFPYQTSSLRVEVLKTVGTTTTTTDVTNAARSSWNSSGSYTYTDTYETTIGKSTTPVPASYRIKITATPSGWGSTQQVATSNSLSPWVPSPISTFDYVMPVTTVSATNQAVKAAW